MRLKGGSTAALVLAIAVAGILAPAAATAATQSKSTLAEGVGMHAKPSVRVKALQRMLVRSGFHIGKTGVDGRFGPKTRAAVRRAQAANHLAVTGSANRATRRALRAGAAHKASAKHTTTTTKAAAMTSEPVVDRSTPPARATSGAGVVHLGTQKHGHAALIAAIFAIALAAVCGLALARERRRYNARLDAYRLRSVPAPEMPATEPAQAEPEPAQPPAPTTRSGLQPGAAVIGCITGANGGVRRRSPEREIERACERGGWQLVEIVQDEHDYGAILERPALAGALERIARGEAQGLVVNDARLLSRSADFAKFVAWFRDADAALVALDLGLDTSTPEGSRVATSLITLNGWAGQWIASRTRQSTVSLRGAGAKPGPLSDEDRADLLERIATLHDSGLGSQEIADQLNDEHVPTLYETERWWPSTIQSALRYWRAASRPTPLESHTAGGRAAD
jgi:DNA invertase Pin-like site-specific DNA recombinase/peptidoglycan hydrolase-like protein with peptidoglycan-binding domain